MIKEFKPTYPHFEKLKDQLLTICREQQLGQEFVPANPSLAVHRDRQLAVQTNGEIDLHSGVGSSRGKDAAWEKSFNQIHPIFKDTLVEDYINWLSVPVYRARIMCAYAKSSYSIHKDLSPRLHLPLITNQQAFFLFAEPSDTSLHHLPADGKTFWVDTTKLHSFINGGTQERFHLVMIVEE